ncbi:MAG: septum formation inhibitor Maf [Anaerolineaceae bacterium]|nr:MAG: septum formation inhibitor Maf [Anaerolineaceae bacterium]
MLVLASNSPRRKELLALGGWPFEIIVADVDETPRANESPRDYVLRLAEEKARASSLRADVSQVVLAADTTVVDGDAILGKPADPSEAKRMLRQLRGRVHQVLTGIAALRVNDGHLVRDVCVTDVPMRNYSDAEIESYVASGDPLDKAGAYAIQHADFNPVATMAGCYASVMGLPLCHVTRLLAQMDVPAQADVPAHCQKFLTYSCPVFADILRGA